MANESILNAFERMWQHTVARLNNKANKADVDNLSALVGDRPVAEQIADATINSVSDGTGNNSLVVGDGVALGDYSVAGGTTDKSLITNIVGDAASIFIPTPEAAEASGDMSMSFGAGTVAQAAGTMALGINSVAGAKGYYMWSISGNTITLSLNQKTLLSSRKKPNSLTWKVGQLVVMNNDTSYVYRSKITDVNTTNMTITVDSLPFTSLTTHSLSSSYMPNDLFIYVPESPESGEIEMGYAAYAHGYENKATGILSTAIGYKNTAIDTASFVTGRENTGAFASLVGGYNNMVTGAASFSSGSNNTASGNRSHAEGHYTKALGDYSHAEGFGAEEVLNTDGSVKTPANPNIASGTSSHVEGRTTKAYAHSSHAEGYGSVAGFADMDGTDYNTPAAHAEGWSTTASGIAAHSEGYSTEATGDFSHAEGQDSVASGKFSHAEGFKTTASGSRAHSQGDNAVADGNYSHAGGRNTIANGRSQFVIGECNVANGQQASGANSDATRSDYAFIVGNGKSTSSRSNAHTLDWNGNAWYAGNITTGENKAKVLTEEDLSSEVEYFETNSAPDKIFGLQKLKVEYTDEVGMADGTTVTISYYDINNVLLVSQHLQYDEYPNWTESPEGAYYADVLISLYTIEGNEAKYKLSYYAYDSKLYSYLNSKVDKVDGKQLSTNDFTDDEKAKLSKTVGQKGTGSNAEIFNDYTRNIASGEYAHAEGLDNIASGKASHVEGNGNKAGGYSSSAINRATEARGHGSFAAGQGTFASGADQFVIGTYNEIDTKNMTLGEDGKPINQISSNEYKKSDYVFIVGNGTHTKPSNAATIDWNGNAWFKGDIYVNNVAPESKVATMQDLSNVATEGCIKIEVGGETAFVQGNNNTDKTSFDFDNDVIAANVTLLVGDEYLDTAMWVQTTSGRAHWSYITMSDGSINSIKTKVTIANGSVTVESDAFDSTFNDVRYQVTAFTK